MAEQILDDVERIDARQSTCIDQRFHRGIAFGAPLGAKTAGYFAMNHRRSQALFTEIVRWAEIGSVKEHK